MGNHTSAAKLSCVLAGALLACAMAQARVTKIVIDETVPAFCKGGA